jgi:hypothetical protein
MAIGAPPSGVSRPPRRTLAKWFLAGGAVTTSVVAAYFLFKPGPLCPAVLIKYVATFSVVDDVTRRPICDATIDGSGKRSEANVGADCKYEIELDNLNLPEVTVSHKGYLSKTITLGGKACFSVFEQFPSEIALARSRE